ncbi:MAG: gliding motility protein GldB [Tannerella sp.]|jgi:hypothetical protein|nr:gliding motility protein GldB [Tannerella sp.]
MIKFRLSGITALFTAILFYGCSRQSHGMVDAKDLIVINRFDSALYLWIDTDSACYLNKVIDTNSQLLGLLGKTLFSDPPEDSAAFCDRLINYYSEPTLKSLYKDELSFYSSDSERFKQFKEELSFGFAEMKRQLPSIQIPAVSLHVSGFQQNIIVADSLLSCSADRYLGSDYPLYQDFFYPFQRKAMTADRIAKDCLSAWLRSEYPFKGDDKVLLDRMLYEGKIIYALIQTGYNYTFQNILTVSDDEYKWFLEYEPALWTTINERKHLDTPDLITTSRYFLPQPATFIAADAPGNPGSFIGYRIICDYMKRTGSSLEKLMYMTDYQTIIKKAKYK